MTTTEFLLTADHLKLIQRMYVQWEDIEYGAPAINPKRPYGNSFVVADVFEILGWSFADPDEPSEAEYARAEAIHAETETALQIILVTQSFVPGFYVKQNRYADRSWVRIEPWDCVCGKNFPDADAAAQHMHLNNGQGGRHAVSVRYPATSWLESHS